MSDPILRIIEPRAKDLGDGFKVRRVLPFHAHKMVGPFIFFDHFGPVSYEPGKGFDVRPHPHIGLSTVTFLFEGAIRHRDSLGTDIVIRPGAVNWMTAGHGIVHSERTPDPERSAGQSLHGIQTWVALPKSFEGMAPDFAHHSADTLPRFEHDGAQVTLLAGSAWGHRSPVEFPSPILYFALEASSETEVTLPAALAEERALYVVSGRVQLGDEKVNEGNMVALTPDTDATIKVSSGTKLMVCGGAVLDGKRLIEWNLVATSQDLISEAKKDYEAAMTSGGSSRFPLVPGDEDEYIPLP